MTLEHEFHIVLGGLIIVLLFCTISLVVFSVNQYFKRVKKSETNIDTLITYLKNWNNSISTRQGAFDFYVGLNRIAKEIFKGTFSVLITREEFDRLSLDVIKQLNNQAIELLESDLKRTIIN